MRAGFALETQAETAESPGPLRAGVAMAGLWTGIGHKVEPTGAAVAFQSLLIRWRSEQPGDWVAIDLQTRFPAQGLFWKK